MSTYYGYICLSHDPHLASEHWFNHGEDVLRQAWELERAGNWPSVPEDYLAVEEWSPADVTLRSYGTNAPIFWLRQHPNCVIGLESEYGDITPLAETVVVSSRLEIGAA